MEGRGSLRQLHQQLAEAVTAYGTPEWQSGYEKRPPPPLPTLPPWAMNPMVSATHQQQAHPHAMMMMPTATPSGSSYSREELDDPASSLSSAIGGSSEQESASWRKAPSYFGSMKRLPLQMNSNVDPTHQSALQRRVLPPHEQYNQQLPPKNQQQEAEEEPAGAIAAASPQHRSDPERGEKANSVAVRDQVERDGDPHRNDTPGETNQVEEDHDQPHQELQTPSLPPQQSGFFRPWKKNASSDDDTRDNNCSEHGAGEGEVCSPQVNKWKVRALLNPFARRKPMTKPSASSFATAPDPGYDEYSSPLQEDRPPPSSSSSATAAGPKRPTTPLPAPSSLLPHSSSGQHLHRPPGLRSRGEVEDEDPEQEESDEKIHRDVFDESLSKPRVAPPPFRRKAKVLIPLDTPKQQQGAPRESSNREEREDFQAFKAPVKTTKHVIRETNQQHVAAKAKPKASTLNALAEIQRKRNERRAQQAEEKHRMQTELEEHGDDVGYKFRRLIQKYRDALPAFQKQQKTALPPLTKSGTTGSGGISSARLSVFVRKRPLSKKELKAKGYDIISCLYAVAAAQGKAKPSVPTGASRQELMLHEPKLKVDCSETLEHHQFRFDGVFDEVQDNAQVYGFSVGPLIPYLIHDRILDARNGNHTNLTVFAYGQTGSGKTYTMKSIYRQAATDLFERVDACSGMGTVMVGVSFYEIYMNNVNDLLNGRSRLQLMEDGEGTVQLLGLKEVMISSPDELLDLVKHGEDSRATSANAVHDDSSRSHALLRITLYPGGDANSNSSTILARLSMVDLAGSERACDTQSDNKNTRMEGAEINKSLLALKECIRALDRGATHIPFRQSKLTQLLRDSFLSENSKTVMIATVSPWSESCNHTLNTLRYADRLKEIGGQ